MPTSTRALTLHRRPKGKLRESDFATVHMNWNVAVDARFPEGPESATGIIVDADSAEYWDFSGVTIARIASFVHTAVTDEDSTPDSGIGGDPGAYDHRVGDHVRTDPDRSGPGRMWRRPLVRELAVRQGAGVKRLGLDQRLQAGPDEFGEHRLRISGQKCIELGVYAKMGMGHRVVCPYCELLCGNSLTTPR